MNEPINSARILAIRELAAVPTPAEHDEYRAAIRDLLQEVARLTAEVVTLEVSLDLDATGENVCPEEAAARALIANSTETTFLMQTYRSCMRTITGISLTDEQFRAMLPIVTADQTRHVRAMIRVANKVREELPAAT